MTVQLSGRVFVLGAGASAFAGYPLATGLLGFVRNFNTLEVRAREIASRIFGKLSEAESQFLRQVVRDGSDSANLEQLLTYLELYHSFPGTMFHLNPWTESDSDDIRRVITDRFLDYQYDLNKRVWDADSSNQVRQIAERWGKRLQPGDVVLTFNWDILHEIVFWRSGIWSYKDGYGFSCGSQGHDERSSATLLLKLHGSVNWVQREESDPVSEFANIGDFFVGSRDWDSRPHFDQAQIDSGRKLVLPTYLKDISSNRILLELWTKARTLLATAREITVLGYSLNRVDHPARLLFGTALSDNHSLDSVTVVAPDQTEWPIFLQQIGKRINNIRKKFEDWL